MRKQTDDKTNSLIKAVTQTDKLEIKLTDL